MRVALILLPAIALAQANENLNATAWTQTAVEHHGSCRQAYQTARLMLDRALKDKSWTAALEQTNKFRKLPPAIILDLDETVLDNGPAMARNVLNDVEFNTPDWTKWVMEAKARALPGAVEFLHYALSKGVAVFYVSNREAAYEQDVLRNLRAIGAPADANRLHLLGERPEWQADKGTRRLEVAATHRILLLVGDDLGDFLPGARTTASERARLMIPHEIYWGMRWIILPNPMYGSWETALYPPGVSLDRAGRLEQKRRALDGQLGAANAK